MKEPETGDIFLNPETLNLFITYKSNFSGNWYLRLVHDDYKVIYDRGEHYIFLGNIYDLTKNKCEEEVRKIMFNRRQL